MAIDTQVTLIFKQPRLTQLQNRDACEECFFFMNSWKCLQAYTPAVEGFLFQSSIYNRIDHLKKKKDKITEDKYLWG